MNAKVIPPPPTHRPPSIKQLSRSMSAAAIVTTNIRSPTASNSSQTGTYPSKAQEARSTMEMLSRYQSSPSTQGDGARRSSEDPRKSQDATIRMAGSTPRRPKGPAPAPPPYAPKVLCSKSSVERHRTSLTGIAEKKLSDMSLASRSDRSCDKLDGAFLADADKQAKERHHRKIDIFPNDCSNNDHIKSRDSRSLTVRHTSNDSDSLSRREKRPRSSPNAFVIHHASSESCLNTACGYPVTENIYFSIDEPIPTGGNEEAASKRSSPLSGADSATSLQSDMSARELVALCAKNKLTLPVSLKVNDTCVLGGRVVEGGSEATLCAVHQRAAAQLVDHGQCIIYESVDGTAPVNCLYEVVRGSLEVGCRPQYLWSIQSFASLRKLLSENPSRRRIKLNSEVKIDDDTVLKKDEQFVVACDDIVADALTHVPCWRLSMSSGLHTATHLPVQAGKDIKLPWRAVELIMMPLDQAAEFIVCVNSDLLRLREIVKRYSRELPVQVLACEYVSARPAPFAMSGDPSVQCRLSTMSELSLLTVIKETVLLLLVDGVAMLVPESQPFSFSLVAEKLPSAKTMSSALSTLATQTLLIRHNYVQSATPVVRTSSVEEPREGGEDSVLQEGIYMDMSAGVYGHVRTDSISSCGTKPYRSVTLDPSVAVEPLSESMENAGNPLADDTPPPLPSDDRPKVRGLTMPLPLPTVASDGYAVAKELFAAKSHSPSPDSGTVRTSGSSTTVGESTIERHPNASMAIISSPVMTYPSSSVVVKTRSKSTLPRPIRDLSAEHKSENPHYYKPFTKDGVQAKKQPKAADDSTIDGIYGKPVLPRGVKQRPSQNNSRDEDWRWSKDDLDFTLLQKKDRQESSLTMTNNPKSGLRSLFRRTRPKVEPHHPTGRDKFSPPVNHGKELTSRSTTMSVKRPNALSTQMSVDGAGRSSEVLVSSTQEPQRSPIVRLGRSHTTATDSSVLSVVQAKNRRPPPPRPINPPTSKPPPRPTTLPQNPTTPTTTRKDISKPRLEQSMSIASHTSTSLDAGEVFTPTSIGSSKFHSSSPSSPVARKRPVSPSRASVLAVRAKSESSSKSASVHSPRHMSVRESASPLTEELSTLSMSMPNGSSHMLPDEDEYAIPRVDCNGQPIQAVLPRSRSPSPPSSPLPNKQNFTSPDSSKRASPERSVSPAAGRSNPPFAAPGKPPRAKSSSSSTTPSASPSVTPRNSKGNVSTPTPSPRKVSVSEPRPLSACVEAQGVINDAATAHPANGIHYKTVPVGNVSGDNADGSTKEPIYDYSKLKQRVDDGYCLLNNTPPSKAPKAKKPLPATRPKPAAGKS